MRIFQFRIPRDGERGAGAFQPLVKSPSLNGAPDDGLPPVGGDAEVFDSTGCTGFPPSTTTFGNHAPATSLDRSAQKRVSSGLVEPHGADVRIGLVVVSIKPRSAAVSVMAVMANAQHRQYAQLQSVHILVCSFPYPPRSVTIPPSSDPGSEVATVYPKLARFARELQLRWTE